MPMDNNFSRSALAIQREIEHDKCRNTLRDLSLAEKFNRWTEMERERQDRREDLYQDVFLNIFHLFLYFI